MRYVETGTILDKIMAHKLREINITRAAVSFAEVRKAAALAPPPLDVIEALTRDTVALIAEVKRASPSKGVLMEPFFPVDLARTYTNNGAAMISVLTDSRFFRGELAYLQRIRRVVEIPLLRKEFMLDPYQVYEARGAGADAILLIVAALEDAQLAQLHTLATDLGMTPLVEVHNEAELERALKLNPTLIGVNNRDLKTFKVDMETTGRIANLVPKGVTLVAESGMKSAADVQRMGQLGAHAVLIGEGLVTARDIAATVKAFSKQAR